jgi:hypothetical protein
MDTLKNMWIVFAIIFLGWTNNAKAQHIWVGQVSGKPTITMDGKATNLRVGRLGDFETLNLNNGDKVILHKGNTQSCELSKAGSYQVATLTWKAKEKPLSERIWAYLEATFGFATNPDNKKNLEEKLAGISRGVEEESEMFLPVAGQVNKKESLVFWWPNPMDEKFDVVLTSESGKVLCEKKGVIGDKLLSSSYYVIKKIPKGHDKIIAKIKSQQTGAWSREVEIIVSDTQVTPNAECNAITDDTFAYQLCNSENQKQQGYINQAAVQLIKTDGDEMDKLTMLYLLIK